MKKIQSITYHGVSTEYEVRYADGTSERYTRPLSAYLQLWIWFHRHMFTQLSNYDKVWWSLTEGINLVVWSSISSDYEIIYVTNGEYRHEYYGKHLPLRLRLWLWQHRHYKRKRGHFEIVWPTDPTVYS